MLSGPFGDNLDGILCLQSAFTSTNKQTWGRTSTEKKCSSSQSTLGPRDHPQPCSRLFRPASTARSSKRPSSRSSSKATEARWCQVKHFCKGVCGPLGSAQNLNPIPSASCPSSPVHVSRVATSLKHHSGLGETSCCRSRPGVGCKAVGGEHRSSDSGEGQG